MGTQRDKMERRLKIFDLRGKSGTTWIVVDMKNKEVLAIGIKEITDYSTDRPQRMVMYEPIEFKQRKGAQDFVDGNTSIGHIQESLTELNVGFQKTFIR